MNGMIEYAFVVNSFNRLKLMKMAIGSLLDCFKDDERISIVVFEAGSTDGSVEYLQNIQQAYPKSVFVEKAEKKTSFSAGCNLGVKAAAAVCPNLKAFVLFETDNFLQSPEPIYTAIRLMEKHPNFGAVGFTVKKHDNSPLSPGCKFLKISATILGLTVSHKLGLERMDTSEWNIEVDIAWQPYEVAYTSPLLVNLKAWQLTDGMDEVNFPFSLSDTDWCWRLYKAGFEIAVIKTDMVIHDNLSNISAWSSKRVYDNHRARLLAVEKHYGKLMNYAIRPLLGLRHFFEFVAMTIQKRGKETIKSRRLMVVQALKGYPLQ